jgi:hypothetical protein
VPVVYDLWFWRAPSAGASADPVAVHAALAGGRWEAVPACEDVLAFRRDLISSDPDWVRARFLPAAGSPEPQDRYVVVRLPHEPASEGLRDLDYVGRRNRLVMFDPQAAGVPSAPPEE